MKYFVVSDLHGDINALIKLLEFWDEENEIVIFLGDLGSRGEDSLPIMKFVMDLVKSGKAIWLKGNHEVMLDEFLYEPQIYKSYLSDFVGGMETIKSFIYDLLGKGYKESELGNLDNLVKIINKEYKELIDFMENLPLYHMDNDLFFVHAGINTDTKNIAEMDKHTMLWGSQIFIEEPHMLDKIVIFGHLPTQNLKSKGAIWLSKCGKKLNLDGGGFIKHDKNASVNAIKISSNKRNKKIKTFRYYTNTKVLEKGTITLGR